MSTTRRIPRSRRALGATVLLITAIAAGVAAIIVSSVPWLIAATCYALLTGVVSGRLLYNEVRQVRLDWAQDRAALADDNRRETIVRAAEGTAFAQQMSTIVNLRNTQLAALRDTLVTAEIGLAQSRERLSAERARTAALQDDADSAHSDLASAYADLQKARDALAASESTEMQVRAELLAWEQAAADPQSSRRPA